MVGSRKCIKSQWFHVPARVVAELTLAGCLACYFLRPWLFVAANSNTGRIKALSRAREPDLSRCAGEVATGRDVQMGINPVFAHENSGFWAVGPNVSAPHAILLLLKEGITNARQRTPQLSHYEMGGSKRAKSVIHVFQFASNKGI